MKAKKCRDADAEYARQPVKAPTQSQEFKALQKEWDAKLKASGFDDIEDTTREDRPLKAWHNFRFKRTPIVQREATETYIDSAKALLLTYPFKNPTHRRIWELHCEGKSRREIEEAISGFKKTYKHANIQFIINKIAREIK